MNIKNKKINIKNSSFSKKIKKLLSAISKKLKLEEQKFNLLELILLVCVAFVFGVFISEAFVYQQPGSNKNTINSLTNTTEIQKVYNSIISNYYQEIDETKLAEAAINGMFSFLGDGYSLYYDQEQTDEFNELVNGTYYGIGLEISMSPDGEPIITRVFDNTPASKADFKVGDIITAVDGDDVDGKTLDEITSVIKGNDNKLVKVVVKRENNLLEKSLATSKIDIPSVFSEIFEENDKRIGYIYISIFALNSDEQFESELKKLEQSQGGIDSLIIDVRDNVGGHLETTKNILNLFLDKNEIMYQINKKGTIQKVYATQDNDREYPVAILANSISASGSEILVAAFKEEKNSVVIGETTFGKGTVQQAMNLNTGGMFKLTIETWLTPLGNEINKVGIKPTIEVMMNDEYYDNPIKEKDNQLQQAIEYLKDK